MGARLPSLAMLVALALSAGVQPGFASSQPTPSATPTASPTGPPEEVRPTPSATPTASSSPSPTATASPEPVAEPPPPRVVRARLALGGLTRSYVLVLPAERPPAPLPLLVMLHGRDATYEIAAARTGFNHLARVGAAAVAYPIAAGPSWNAGRCCDAAAARGVDDVGFVTAVIGAAARHVPVDPRRVLVAGHSTGGMMAYRLACERPRVVAAIASVGGNQVVRHCPTGPQVSVLQITGTADLGVPYYGTDRSPVLGVWLPPVPTTVAAWRGRDGCTSAEARRQVGRVWIRTWAQCRSRSEVQLTTYEGIRHGWPQAKDGYAASDLVWSFLRHRIRST